MCVCVRERVREREQLVNVSRNSVVVASLSPVASVFPSLSRSFSLSLSLSLSPPSPSLLPLPLSSHCPKERLAHLLGVAVKCDRERKMKMGRELERGGERES